MDLSPGLPALTQRPAHGAVVNSIFHLVFLQEQSIHQKSYSFKNWNKIKTASSFIARPETVKVLVLLLSYATDPLSGILALGMMSGLGRKPSEDNKVIVLWAKSFI